jgi:hypothetical protein
MTDTVVVPRWALEFIMENAHLCDRGISDEGWPSPRMREAEAAIEAALKPVPKGRPIADALERGRQDWRDGVEKENPFEDLWCPEFYAWEIGWALECEAGVSRCFVMDEGEVE